MAQLSGRAVSRQNKLEGLIAWQGAGVTGYRYTASCSDIVHATVTSVLLALSCGMGKA